MATATADKPTTDKSTSKADEPTKYRFKVLAGIHAEGKYTADDIPVKKGIKQVGDQKYYGPHADLGDVIVTHRNLLKLNRRGYPPKFALLKVGETGLGINNPDGLDSLDIDALKAFAKVNMIDLPVDADKRAMILAIRDAIN